MYFKEKRQQDLKAWTEDYLMVLEELAMFFPSRETGATDTDDARGMGETIFQGCKGDIAGSCCASTEN